MAKRIRRRWWGGEKLFHHKQVTAQAGWRRPSAFPPWCRVCWRISESKYERHPWGRLKGVMSGEAIALPTGPRRNGRSGWRRERWSSAAQAGTTAPTQPRKWILGCMHAWRMYAHMHGWHPGGVAPGWFVQRCARCSWGQRGSAPDTRSLPGTDVHKGRWVCGARVLGWMR